MDNLQEVNKKPREAVIFDIEDDEFMVSPVTFLDDKKTVTDDSLNGLFTTAYDGKLVSDISHNIALSQINVDDGDIERHKSRNKISDYEVIYSYIVMNISDLVTNTLLRFINEKFGADGESMKVYFSEDFMKDIDVKSLLYDYTRRLNFSTLKNIDTDPSYYFISLDEFMAGLYPILISDVFDKYITNIVDVTFKSGSIDSLYTAIYQETYGKEPDTIPSVDVCYTMCTTILREVMDAECMELRAAMTLVAKNAAIMCNNLLSENPQVHNIIMNKIGLTDMIKEND